MYVYCNHLYFSNIFYRGSLPDGVTIVDESKKSEELLLLSTLIASDFKYLLRS